MQWIAVPFMRSMVVLHLGSTSLFFCGLWTPAWLSPALLKIIHLSCWPHSTVYLVPKGADKFPSSYTALSSLFYSLSLFLLTIFALHKLHPEQSSRFCIEERQHKAYLPSYCFSHKLLLSLSLFSPSSVAQTLPGLHRLRTEIAGKCCLRLVFLSSPFSVSPHFLCLVYCILGQRFFWYCADNTMVKYNIW